MNFIERLRSELNKDKYLVIPDIKCFSPKDGDLLRGRDPIEIALSLLKAGAPVLSVVTEEKEFKGSLDLMAKIAKATKLPVLRKDFIHTKEDLLRTKQSGASAILLMCSCLNREEMIYLYNEAIKIGLDPFVETRSKEELEFATELGAELIGINNRNILELERDDGDISRTLKLLKYAPKDALLVSESSIQSPEEVKMAIKAGADMVLVGTAILKAEDTEDFYKRLSTPTSVKICGLKREEDVRTCMANGVHILGFVTKYPLEVPWNLKKEEAKSLMDLVSPPHKTCLVTGGDAKDVIKLAKELRPDMLQLHYNESLEETKLIAESLYKEGIEIIKTVPLDKADLKQAVEDLCKTKISALLVDTRDGSRPLESEGQIDEERFKLVKEFSTKRVFLAGGINPSNIDEVLEKMNPELIDIMTGVENSPGVKDKNKISEIMIKLRDYNFARGE